MDIMNDIDIIPFDVHNASDEEWAKFLKFRKERYLDKGASRPTHQISDEKFQEILKIPPKKLNVLRYNVFLKSDPNHQIGEIYFSYYKKSASGDKKLAMVNVSLLSAFRQKGYGRILLGKLVELANRYKKSKLLFQTTEEDGLIVIEQFKAQKINVHQQFKLKIREANWDLLKKWSEKSKSILDSVRFEWLNVTENIPKEIIEQYTRIFATAVDEHPKWHINKRSELTPEMVKQDIKNLVSKKGGKWELGLIREKNDDISGLTELKWNPSRPNVILQLVTHIKLHYRGRGRGKLLKVETLNHVKNNYPSVDTIKIGYVGDENSVLYNINKRLGFKQQYSQVSFEVSTKHLEDWVNRTD